MSKSALGVLIPGLPGSKTDPFKMLTKKKDMVSAAEGAASAAPVAERTKNAADRQSVLEAQAAAAGAKRIDNDMDMLGRGRTGTPDPKRRYASRVLLGE